MTTATSVLPMFETLASLVIPAFAFAVPCLVADVATGTAWFQALTAGDEPMTDTAMTNADLAAVAMRNEMREETQRQLAEEIAESRAYFEELRGDVGDQAHTVTSLDAEDMRAFAVLTDEELERLADDSDYDQINQDIAAWYAEEPLAAALFFGDYAAAYDSELFANYDEMQREIDDRYDSDSYYGI